MTDVRVALTCADYARVLPLATGEVRPKGIALTMILGNRGSWPARAEMLRRAVQDPEVQGGEWSMAQYLYRMEKGDRRYVGLPVFPLRNFTARDLYVRRDGPVRRPQDLAGKRIGMYSYTASGSIWYRHFLRYLGLDPLAIQWWVGDIDTPWSATPMDTSLPPGVKTPPAGRSLSDMLVAGDLEAIYSPPRPQAYHPHSGPIARLFPDFRPVEQEYFRKTGAFPPQHLIVLRREAWEANRWIARGLTEAFIARPTTSSPRRRKASPTRRRGSRPSSRTPRPSWARTSIRTGSSRTGRRSRCSPARRTVWVSRLGVSRSRSTSRTSWPPDGGRAGGDRARPAPEARGPRAIFDQAWPRPRAGAAFTPGTRSCRPEAAAGGARSLDSPVSPPRSAGSSSSPSS